MKRIICLATFLFVCLDLRATHKVYLLHGYSGTGLELKKIEKAIEKLGFPTTNFKYPSLTQEIDSAGKILYAKIKKERYDTVSFVTHSMGGLVVRSLFRYIEQGKNFPVVYRIVMIAPPNKGTRLADYYKQFGFIKMLAGPNINNLTTDSLTGSIKYPIPESEVGLIVGTKGKKRRFTARLEGENDGVVLTKDTKMGIERDVYFTRSSHVGLLFSDKVKKNVVLFLKSGKFSFA
jgi:triacylglycerol lipase